MINCEGKEGQHAITIAYEIYDCDRTTVVFTGIPRPGSEKAGTTEDRAMDIIMAIANDADINPKLVDFFDLETHSLYPNIPAGEIVLKQIILDWKEGGPFTGLVHKVRPSPQVKVLEDFGGAIFGGFGSMNERRERELPRSANARFDTILSVRENLLLANGIGR